MELIATLPPVHRRELFMRIMHHPLVSAVRYNTGTRSPYSVKDTVAFIARVAGQVRKSVWIDLKGRQLRIEQWTDPYQGVVELSHAISVDTPAKIYFRGDDSSNITHIDGKTIYIDPPPKYALGAGQAVNVHGNNLKINGYLTSNDYEFLHHSCGAGLRNFMLSFVESMSDIDEVEVYLANNAIPLESMHLALKIESPLGVQFVNSLNADEVHGYTLMAARDDLFINTPPPKPQIIQSLQNIVEKNPSAVVASRIFSGLEHEGIIGLADFNDLRLMQLMGYKRFMLSDGICAKHFDAAMTGWQEFIQTFPGGQMYE